MNFTLTHGVTVSYGYGGALVGHIFVPPGVTARFVDGVATAHTDSGAKVHGTIVDLTRRIYDRRNLPEVLSPTSPLIGWTKDQLMNSGQLRPDARPSGDGSAQILTWNHFEFVVVFESELDSEFSVLLPALEIDGEHASVSDLRFTKKMIGEWTLQPCV